METDRLWYKDAIFYEIYIRAFYDSNADGQGDIQGLIQKLPYIKGLGIDCIWIQPHYPSPLKDDGYDISDYYGVHQDYGTVEDFKQLIDTAHQHGLRVIADLVLNHTSDQHEWFKQARASRESPFRDFYVWSDTDKKYADARIIFLDTEKSNWAWDEAAQQYYWHRFYTSQPDLNFDYPPVRAEMLKVVDFWLDLGLDGFRADATPYLFEREGTNCENLPETHAFLKQIRKHIDEKYPGRMILSEANQWPQDVRPYFGDGDEVNMNFHFPLMPRIYIALARGDISPVKEILAQTPDIPENCQWCTFLRNHDELTLEMVTPAERQYLWEVYAPEPRMRLNLGIRRRLAPLLDNDFHKVLLANALLFSLPGAPVIYYGDEIGMGDDIWLHDRDGVRTPMQWDESLNAGFSSVDPERLYDPVIGTPSFKPEKVNVADQLQDPNSLLRHMQRMIAVRKQHPAFGRGEFRWAETDLMGLAAFWRIYRNERLLLVHNLTDTEQLVDFATLAEHETYEVIFGQDVDEPDSFKLMPYGFTWLRCTP